MRKEFISHNEQETETFGKQLGESLNLRYTPELVFEIDHSIEYGDHINQIIKTFTYNDDEV